MLAHRCLKTLIKLTDTALKDSLWLPDLCNPLALLRLLLLAVLVSVIMTLLRSGVSGFSIELTGLLFFYSVWVVFVLAAGLCFLRRLMPSMSVLKSTIFALGWLFLGSSICAWLAHLVCQNFLMIEDVLLIRFWLETMLAALIIGSLVLRFLFVHHQLQSQQKKLMQAQFDALQARIRPHFLFNSLNSIATLAGMDARRTEDAILNLSDILRATLGERTSITLEEELDICTKYLEIEKLRMGERLQIDMQISDSLKSQKVPSLCLQPLVENAVLHGLQKMPSGGVLSIKVSSGQSHGMQIRIENPVPDSIEESSGSKTALDNIRARLEQFYEDGVDFQTSLENGKFKVCIDIRKQHD